MNTTLMMIQSFSALQSLTSDLDVEVVTDDDDAGPASAVRPFRSPRATSPAGSPASLDEIVQSGSEFCPKLSNSRRARRWGRGRLAEFETRSRREVAWFYSDDARVDQASVAARQKIGAWIAALPPWHRGALALAHDRRDWPRALREATTKPVALIVRIECIAHPGVGSRESLERAAVARLEKRLLDEGKHALARHEDRASELMSRAMRAYRKVRGEEPSALPTRRSTQRVEREDHR
jgi:hypothetical protein